MLDLLKGLLKGFIKTPPKEIELIERIAALVIAMTVEAISMLTVQVITRI